MDDKRETKNCECYRLLCGDIKVWQGEKDPIRQLDHICDLTMRQSCLEYLNDTTKGIESDRPPFIRINEDLAFSPESFDEYPIRVFGSVLRLMLVIRRWVEHPPEERLLDYLKQDPFWNSCFSLDCVNNPNRSVMEIEELVNSAYRPGMLPLIPNSPTTKRYVYQRICGVKKDDEGPCRSARVTTFYLSDDYAMKKRGQWYIPPLIISQITEVAQWSSEPVMRLAVKAVRDVERSLLSLSQFKMPPPDLRKLNGKQDYLNLYLKLNEHQLTDKQFILSVYDMVIKYEETLSGNKLEQYQKKLIKKKIDSRVYRHLRKNSSKK